MGRKRQTELFLPRFGGKQAEIIELDPEERASIVIKIGEQQMLYVMWDQDEAGGNYFRIRMLGFKDGQPVTKQYTKSKTTTAFYGEVSVVGPGRSELWSSMGYEDPDVVDDEGNVTNKPREVFIIPKQDY